MPKKFSLLFNFLFAGILIGLAFSLNPGVERASAQAAVEKTILYFFWGNGCPHCAEAEPFLKDLAKRYPQLEVHAYEIWYNQDNQALFQKMGSAFGFEPSGVPGIFLGDKHWVGYSSDLGKEIESAVSACALNACKDAGAGVVSGGAFDVWNAAGIASASQDNLPLIIGVVLGVIILGLLIYFVVLPRLGISTARKTPAKMVRRH